MTQGTNGSSGQQLTIGATITDNGSTKVNVVRGGDVYGANLYLSGENTYTGKTSLSVSAAQTAGRKSTSLNPSP